MWNLQPCPLFLPLTFSTTRRTLVFNHFFSNGSSFHGHFSITMGNFEACLHRFMKQTMEEDQHKSNQENLSLKQGIPFSQALTKHFISLSFSLNSQELQMDFVRILFAVIGFSSSFYFVLPSFKRWQRQHVLIERLKIISQALERAEERASRFQERHDRILSQICSYYLVNQDLEDALAAARAAMNEALEYAVVLRKMQLQILRALPDEVDVSRADSSPG